jgi:hypothetical protein
MRRALTGILLLSALVAGCGSEASESEVSEDDLTAGGALPISGDFYLTSLKGDSNGNAFQRQFEKDELGVTFRISGEGNGTMTASGSCRPPIPNTPTGAGAPADGFRDTSGMVLAVGNLIATYRCNGEQEVRTVYLSRHGEMFGDGQRFGNNKGVLGEQAPGPNVFSAGDRECKSLRGVRYINIGFGNRSIACIGYLTAYTNRLVMLLQRHDEITLQRMHLTRR